MLSADSLCHTNSACNNSKHNQAQSHKCLHACMLARKRLHLPVSQAKAGQRRMDRWLANSFGEVQTRCSASTGSQGQDWLPQTQHPLALIEKKTTRLCVIPEQISAEDHLCNQYYNIIQQKRILYSDNCTGSMPSTGIKPSYRWFIFLPWNGFVPVHVRCSTMHWETKEHTHLQNPNSARVLCLNQCLLWCASLQN